MKTFNTVIITFICSFAFFVCINWFFNSFFPPGFDIYIDGLENEIGAEIFLKLKIGQMIETESSIKGERFATGVDIDVFNGKKIPVLGLFDNVRLKSGEYTLIFKKDGYPDLTGELKVDGEKYISINFEEMSIYGDMTPFYEPLKM
ncbi:MAG: hypothetical protein WC337_06965 [Candidatus Muiribacteriota bacterium]